MLERPLLLRAAESIVEELRARGHRMIYFREVLSAKDGTGYSVKHFKGTTIERQ